MGASARRHGLGDDDDDTPVSVAVAEHVPPPSRDEFVSGERRIPEPEGVRIHPAARIVPMMTEAEGAGLERSIREQGYDQQKPLIFIDTPDGEALLDGRCRLGICLRLGWRLEDVPRAKYSGDAPYTYVLGDIGGRRNLTKDQRLAIVEEVRPHIEAEAKQRMVEGGRRGGKGGNDAAPASGRDESARTAVKLAKAAGADVGIGSAKAMIAIGKRAPELKPLIVNRKLTVAEARRLVDVPAEERAPKVAALIDGADKRTVLPPPKPRSEMPHLGRQLGRYADLCGQKLDRFRDLLSRLVAALAAGETSVRIGKRDYSLAEARDLLAEHLPRPRAAAGSR